MRRIYLFQVFMLVLVLLIAGGCGGQSEQDEIIIVSRAVSAFPSHTPPPTLIPTATLPPLPTSTRIPPPTQTSIPEIVYELPEAIREGIVTAQIIGRNLQEIQIELEVNVDFTFGLYILPGTLFATDASGVQTMVAIEFWDGVLGPGLELDLTLDVACAEMTKATPSSSHTFQAISPLDSGSEFDGRGDYLTRLVSSDIFSEDFPFRRKQFAIWTITDNPTRDGFVRLGSFGAGSGPSDEEIAFIETIFDFLGIPTTEFNLFQ